MSANPLKQYFRQPAVFIRLPSNGQHWPKNSINMPANGELPVMAMTTMDEITYRTPDALFNGNAVVSVIQSCIPNILDAWQIPNTDLDTILIAIRIATYGHTIDVSSVCPACSTENDYGVDLRNIMDRVKAPDYSRGFKLGDLEIWFKPMTYQEVNANNLLQFEDQKTLQMIQSGEMSDEDRLKTMGEMLKKLTAITTQALCQSIAVIRTPTAQVDENQHIQEWLGNCDRHTFNQVRDHVVELRKASELQPLHVKCTNCNHEYDQQFTLDMTTFFADAS